MFFVFLLSWPSTGQPVTPSVAFGSAFAGTDALTNLESEPTQSPGIPMVWFNRT